MERGVELYFVHLRRAQLQDFDAIGLTDLVGGLRSFPNQDNH
jgi:hypothetical protein